MTPTMSIGRAFRLAAVQVAEDSASKVVLEPSRIRAIVLGQPRFEGEVALRTIIPGAATGLAWTPVGGDIRFIEATRVARKGG